MVGPRFQRASVETRITPTDHELNEWSRMAQDAYRTNRNAFGHRFSMASATGKSGMKTSVYDSLMLDYRLWLVSGWGKNGLDYPPEF